MNKIKVGVIGVGYLGKNHVRIYADFPEVELTGIADINSKVENIAKQYNTRFYKDYKELIKKVDAVSVAVPTALHYEVTKEALMHNCHVLVEKPITRSLREADDLLELSRKKNRIIQVGHVERFNPVFQALQKIKTSPRIIEARRLGPFNPRTADVGVVLDLMIHDIDIAIFLAESEISRIYAIGMSVLSDNGFEDVANARLEFKNGCVANLVASRISSEKSRMTMIFQKEVYITIDYIMQDITIYRKDPTKLILNNPQSSIVVEKTSLLKGEPLKLQLKHFINCLLKEEKPLVSGYHGRHALEIALQILGKIHKGISSVASDIETRISGL